MAYIESEKDSLLRERKAVLLDYGFSEEEAEKIMQACHNELFYSTETVESKLRNLENYGFSREEVRKIVIGLPPILGLNEDSLKAKLRNLEKERKFPNGFVLKFTKEEVKELILSFPAILGYSEYTAGWKIRAMACVSEGDKQEMIEMGKLWMQSARKTVRRANYLNKKGIEWKHTGKVFMSEKNFKRTYGVSL